MKINKFENLFALKKLKPCTSMKSLRKYGNLPFTVAVIHGGPGAPGEMAPVARELASCRGVLDPSRLKQPLKVRFWN
ncbi:MAG: hypothetical protein WB014_00230 [Methanosarcina sp.]